MVGKDSAGVKYQTFFPSFLFTSPVQKKIKVIEGRKSQRILFYFVERSNPGLLSCAESIYNYTSKYIQDIPHKKTFIYTYYRSIGVCVCV